MGSSQSYPGLTEDLLEDYASLTYLSKGEIMYLMKKFKSIDPENIEADYNHRFKEEDIITKFDTLRFNPFKDRLFHVFSSKKDGCFSFEDLIDLCSAMSSECPPDVKAEWAFKIFDLDDDNQISERDIAEILDRLTASNDNVDRKLDKHSKTKICKVILQEINLDKSGTISLSEFKFMFSRLPEFKAAFYFRL